LALQSGSVQVQVAHPKSFTWLISSLAKPSDFCH